MQTLMYKMMSWKFRYRWLHTFKHSNSLLHRDTPVACQAPYMAHEWSYTNKSSIKHQPQQTVGVGIWHNTGLSVTQLMGHLGCLASHWSVPVDDCFSHSAKCQHMSFSRKHLPPSKTLPFTTWRYQHLTMWSTWENSQPWTTFPRVGGRMRERMSER